MSRDTKLTNPKDFAGSNRVPLSLVSDFANAEESLAMLEGALKYGAYNYRITGVRARVYVDAARRHLARWLNGEDRDPKTGVHHLGSVRACMGILLDAGSVGKLIDDRPPANKALSAQLEEMEARVKNLREVFKDYDPHHYTIEETANGTGKQKDRRRK